MFRRRKFSEILEERTNARLAAFDQSEAVSQNVEARFEDRLNKLEAASQTAVDSFEKLAAALATADESTKLTVQALDTNAERAREAADASKKATHEARIATEEAMNQAVANAASLAHREAIEKAVAITGKEASEVAVSLAREEASRIAREAVQSASSEIEKMAREAGAQIESEAKEAIDRSRTITEEAKNRRDELGRVHQELAEENERLEKLIQEQNARADRLASAIAQHTNRLSELADRSAPSPEKSVSQSSLQRSADRNDAAKAFFFDGDTTTNTQKNGKAPTAKIATPDDQSATQQPAQKQPVVTAQDSGTAPAPASASAPPKSEENVRLLDLQRDLDAARLNGHQPTPPETRDAGGRSDHDQPLPLKTSRRQQRSWKEILAAADDAEPLDLGAETKTGSTRDYPDAPNPAASMSPIRADEHETTSQKQKPHNRVLPVAQPTSHESGDYDAAVKVVHRLQSFTRNLDERLYGALPHGLVERFENGERNVFAARLLRLNESDVKKRIRAESAKDPQFDMDIQQFLKAFDGLLEDAARSESVDEELREYLSSPLGRIYLLIGEIVGYFA